MNIPGPIAQPVASLIADPGVMSSVPKLCTRSTGKLLSQACPGKSVVRLSDHLDMIIAVDWDLKIQIKQKQCEYIAHHRTVKNILIRRGHGYQI